MLFCLMGEGRGTPGIPHHPDLVRGVPPVQSLDGVPWPVLDGGGYTIPGLGGYPHDPDLAGGYPHDPDLAGGYPLPRPGMGYPVQGLGMYPIPGLGGTPSKVGVKGYPLCQVWMVGYPHPQTLDRLPLPLPTTVDRQKILPSLILPVRAVTILLMICLNSLS